MLVSLSGGLRSEFNQAIFTKVRSNPILVEAQL
jgi:hypothetical protein